MLLNSTMSKWIFFIFIITRKSIFLCALSPTGNLTSLTELTCPIQNLSKSVHGP